VARRKVIPQLARAVGKQLEDLGFRQSKFDVAISDVAQASRLSGNLKTQARRLRYILPDSTKLNSSSRRIPASRPGRCAPSHHPAKWRA